MDDWESEETTEFYRVPDMPGYYISSNAPRSGEFVPVAMHEKLKRQRDMLLEALQWLDNWLGDKPLSECGRRIRKTLDTLESEK